MNKIKTFAMYIAIFLMILGSFILVFGAGRSSLSDKVAELEAQRLTILQEQKEFEEMVRMRKSSGEALKSEINKIKCDEMGFKEACDGSFTPLQQGKSQNSR